LAGSLLHENYLLGTYTAIMGADFGTRERIPAIWVEFSPYADTETVNRLVRLNLNCITRVRSCGQADLMPEVWNEIVRDEQSPIPNFTCTSDLVNRVARLADTIAVVRVDSPELQSPTDPSNPFRMYKVSLLRLVRGPDWMRRELGGWVELYDPRIATAVDGTKLQPGEQYIFLLQYHIYAASDHVVLYPCGILKISDANLAMVQEIAAKSIE